MQRVPVRAAFREVAELVDADGWVNPISKNPYSTALRWALAADG